MSALTTITGRVIAEEVPRELTIALRPGEGEPIAATKVEADGRFSLIGLNVPPQGRHELILDVHRNGQLVERLPLESPDWEPDVLVDLALDPRMLSEPQRFVRGRLRDADGTPLAGRPIEVVERRLRSSPRRGGGETDKHGRYKVEYTLDGAEQEGRAPSAIVVRARDPKSPRSKPIAESATLFAPEQAEVVDLMVGGGTWPGPSEYERIHASVAPQLGKHPKPLSEADVEYLKGETGLSSEEIDAFAQARAAAHGPSLPADALYGLIRAGLGAGIAEHAAVDPGVVRTTLAAAVAGNVVPRSVEAKIDGVIAALNAVRAAAVADGSDRNAAPIGAVAHAVLSTRAARARLVDLFQRHASGDSFWAAVKSDDTLARHASSLQFATDVVAVVGSHPRLVKELVRRHEDGELSSAADLARFDEDAWKEIVTKGRNPIGAPSDTPGTTPAARVRNYAETLATTILSTFPAASIKAGIEAAGTDKPVAAFLAKHPKFELGTETIDGYIARKAPKTPKATIAALKEIERLSKITPNYKHMEALREEGLVSSRAIARTGKAAFTERFANDLGGSSAAEAVFERAAWLAAAAQHVVAASAPIFEVPLAVLPSTKPEEERDPSLPDWETLFGSIELCECEQCRTVLSPAAYLADILHFLEERVPLFGANPCQVLFRRRGDLGEIELTCANTNTLMPYIDLVNEVLERAVAPQSFRIRGSRSQLNAGALSNAGVLDFAAAGFPLSDPWTVGVVRKDELWWVRDRGWRFVLSWNAEASAVDVVPYPQTSASAEELSANPEHVNDQAYAKLADAVYPWSLPFDLPLEQVSAFVARMGITRDELMRRYQPAGAHPTPSAAAIAAAAIGLGDAERAIVVGTHRSSPRPWLFWGASAPPKRKPPAPAADWADQVQPVRTLLDRARLDYGQLADLLELKFVNAEGSLSIQPVKGADPETCDTSQLAIANLTGGALDRMHRFIRLQRRLGWSQRDLDRVLTAVGVTQFDDSVVTVVSDIERLRRTLRVPVQQVAAWYAPIDTAAYLPSPVDTTTSLYAQLFQNPSVVKRTAGADPFALNAAGEVATTQPLSTRTPGADPDAVAGIRAAVAGTLGASADDIALLLDGPRAVTGTAPTLTVETLSRLYRRISLARALKLKVADLLTLVELTGIDPFVDVTATPRPAVTPSDTARTFALIDALAAIKASRLSIAQLAYLLRGEVTTGSTVAPTDQALATTLTGLRAGLNAIHAATVPAADPQGQQTAAALVGLGWDDTTVQSAVAMLAGTAVYTASLPNVPSAVTLPANLPIGWSAGQLSYTGPMTLADRTTLLALSTGNFQTAVNTLFDAPRAFVATAMTTFVAPVYKAPLATLASTVQFPAEISSLISYDADAKVLTFLGTMTDTQQNQLLTLSSDSAYQTAVKTLHDAPQTYVPAAGEAFLASADSAALFDVAMDPSARFAYVLDRVLTYVRASRTKALLSQTFVQALRLDPESVDQLLYEWADEGTGSTHRPAQDFMDASFVISSDTLSRDRFPATFTTFRRLLKVAQLVSTLSIGSRDLGALIAHSDPTKPNWLGLLDFASLPAAASDRPADFAAWRALYELFHWSVTLPVDTGLSILELLGRADTFDPATDDPAATKTAMIADWATLTSWPPSELEVLLGPPAAPATGGLLGYVIPRLPGPGGTRTPNPFARIATWLRIREAMAAATTLEATCSLCASWSLPSVTTADALAIQQTARAQLGDDAWLDAFKELRNRLRELQRDALVDYLISNPPRGQNWTKPDDLFPYFLADVEMSSCMLTTRIKQAIGSVQLFAQRSLMGLERGVRTSSDPGWAQWKWEGRNAVWAGARQIFLWPENWLQPELQPDASEPFEDLTHKLQQNPVTNETAEAALLGYLEDLYALSRMEVVGVNHQIERGVAGLDVLHVVARTQSKPSQFAYRRRVDGTKWTPWKRVKLDIEADSVLPVVWNRRLMLFWPLMKNEQESAPLTMPAPNSQMPPPKTSLSVQIAWSVFENGKWGAKQLTPNRIILNHRLRPQLPMIALSSQASDVGGLDVDVSINRNQPPFIGGAVPGTAALYDGATFVGLGEVVVVGRAEAYSGPKLSFGGGLAAPRYPATGAANDPWSAPFSGAPDVSNPIPIDTTTLYGRVAALEKAAGLTLTDGPNLPQVPLLGSASAFEVTYPRPKGAFAGADHFFFQDPLRCYFVEKRPPAPPPGSATGGSGSLPPPPPLSTNQPQGYRFHTFYHPFVDTFGRELLRHGIDGLYTRDLQLRPYNYPIPAAGPFSFKDKYSPSANVYMPYPTEEVDYSFNGAFAQYNWELFVHAPLLIAQFLTQNQQFSDAKRWLEYIFDPMDASADPAPQKYWKPAVFHNTSSAQYKQQQIQELLTQLASGSPSSVLVQQVQDWRADPFQPHAIAKLRTSAYQKQVVMRYLDNLIAWGDELFTENTIESINQATQMYILALDVLGPRPEHVPPRGEPIPQTYNSMAPLLDEFSDALVAAESVLAGPPGLVSSPPAQASVALAPMRYFAVPQNQKLLDYWNEIDGRLFKIRHCQNIEGVTQTLPPFEAPIDPGLLVQASAAGVSVAAALAAENAPLPSHRFSHVLAKAKEFTQEVKTLGAALLAAYEKRDAERLAVLRQTQETQLLQAAIDLRQRQMDDANYALEALKVQRRLVEQRQQYYQRQPFVNAGEAVHLALTAARINVHEVAAATELVASILAIVPDLKVGAPTGMGATFGGENLAAAAHALSTFLASTVQIIQSTAGLAQTLGGYQRRAEEWTFQTETATTELEQIDQQILSAQIRVAMAERELANQQLQVGNSRATLELMQTKFTNEQLFDWMAGQTATLYRQCYQLAYDLSLQAERASCHELGLAKTKIIGFGHWDSLHRGLLAGERLSYDLARLESRHMELDRREYELRKTISLAQIQPQALISLRETGMCFINLSESLFDLDYAGHYMRRVKSASLTIPCVAGPYVGVHARAVLLGSEIRMTDDPTDVPVKFTGAVESIATSTGQNDAGVFELNLHDERRLPFEGHGAVGSWQITLDPNANRFDFSTITDVLLNLSYTARQGGDELREAAIGALPAMQQLAFLDVEHDFADGWYRFLQPPDDTSGNTLAFDVTGRFPYQPGGGDVQITGIDVYVALDVPGTSKIKFGLYVADAKGQPSGSDLLFGQQLKAMTQLNGAFFGSTTPTAPLAPGPFLLSIAGADIPATAATTVTVGSRTYKHLDPEKVKALYVVFRYTPAP
jgi:Tc toxin complex TcA C-terminal TcB-binding domain/Neuraminidase-like domain/Salmonella virulence plasmid 28.1kDa A protein